MAVSSNTPSIRKAAVLIHSLDADSAARLLAQLGPGEARALREAMRSLGTVEDEELSCVTAELQRQPKRTPSSSEQGTAAVVLELSEEVAAGSKSSVNFSPRAESPFNSQLADLRQLAACAQTPVTPFGSLIATDSQALVRFLEPEHPQTVAVVLSYLPAEKAAEALSGLPEERQAEVVQRLSELGDTDVDSLRVLEHSLEMWLADQRREQLRRADRMSIVGSILAATQESTRQTILLRLQSRHSGLAHQIAARMAKPALKNDFGRSDRTDADRKPHRHTHTAIEAYRSERIRTSNDRQGIVKAEPSTEAAFEFDDLVELSNEDLAKLLRATDSRVLYCAFAGAGEPLLERISGALPRRERNEFRRQLRSLGPIRLLDIEAAQRAVAHSARRMMENSRAKYPPRRAV